MINFKRKMISVLMVSMFILSINSSLMAFGSNATTGASPTTVNSSASTPLGVQDTTVNSATVPNANSAVTPNAGGVNLQPNSNGTMNSNANPVPAASTSVTPQMGSRAEQDNLYNQMIKGQ
jgi:hypothetical protein